MFTWLLLVTIHSSFLYSLLQAQHAPCDWEISVIEEAPQATLDSDKMELANPTTMYTLYPTETTVESMKLQKTDSNSEHHPQPSPSDDENGGILPAKNVTGPSIHLHQLHQAGVESVRMFQNNTTTENPDDYSAPELSDGSSSASHTIIHNISGISYSAARRRLQLLPAGQIDNISGLVYLRPDLHVFRLQLQLELRCPGASGATLRRLLAQRQLPELSVSGVSAAAGPVELLLQAVPVARDGSGQDNTPFVAPLPVLAPRLTVQTVRAPNIAASQRQLNFASQPGDGGDDPPPAALDLSCLGDRAHSFISRSQATRLARLQRVRLRPPLYTTQSPTGTEPWPAETPPPAVLSGYRYLVQLVLTQFLEREQQQNTTYDQLASPMQRMRERAMLVDGAARFFYFTQPNSVYVPPDSYEKLIPESGGAGVRALPPAIYLDRSDQLQFGFTVPGSVTVRMVARPDGLAMVGVDCYAAADKWQRCTASVRPLGTALDGQHRPAEGLRWATVSLDVQGRAGAQGEDTTAKDECKKRPPVPLQVAIGCPPSTTLLFNFTSTFKAAGLDDKCPRCLCDQGVPCLLYSDVFQPQLVLIDWTTYQSRAFTGNYTMAVLGSGYSADSVPYGSVQHQRSLADRIWAPSISDENINIPDELIENPVFPHPVFNGIKWHCDQYSACPPFVRLRFSNMDVDAGTFCRHELELVVQLYGVPTNTFVDVVTMSVVFGVTLLVSLAYTSALTIRQQRVTPQRNKIVNLYPVQEVNER